MADWASVNTGARGDLSGLLREDMSWLMAMHCLNHRLELAVKDALKGTELMHTMYELNSQSVLHK